jgi:hypothetical protein
MSFKKSVSYIHSETQLSLIHLPSVFNCVVHSWRLHPAPCGVKVVRRRRRGRRAQRLLLQRRHRVVTANAGMVVKGRFLKI